MKKLFSFRNTSRTKLPIVVVSGLPRSGTSMMMKILQAGGLSILTDEIRMADEDNPNGYFEYERVKQMAAGDQVWLKEADGKVVKVISALLEHLPAEHHYKVIFMERDIKEVLASQKKMLNHRGELERVTDEEMAEQYASHLKVVKPWLARQPNMDVFYVGYNKMMAGPEPFCRQIMEFLGMSLNLEKMLEIPNERLYRNRG